MEIFEHLKEELERYTDKGAYMEKVNLAILKVKLAYQKTKMFLIKLKALLLSLIAILTSPLGWIFLGVIFFAILFISTIRTWGPQTFNWDPTSDTELSLDFVSEEKQDEVISLYLANKGLSPEVSAYIAEQVKGATFKKSSGVDLTDCDTSCILSKIEDGDLDASSITLGGFNFKGEDAIRLLRKAKENGVEWTDKSIQVNILKDNIINQLPYHNADLTSPNKVVNGVNVINSMLGKPAISGQAKITTVRELKKKSKGFKRKITRVKALGSGKGKGRVDGGGARDTSRLSAIGTVDASEMISFMESFASETKISTPGQDGSSLATPEMIEAKRLAMEKGGKDPWESLYSSCDRFVATVMKATETDVNFPWGDVDEQYRYVNRNPDLWQKVDNPSDRQSGDVIFWEQSPGDWEHIGIYGVGEDGVQKVYQASFQDYLPMKSVTDDSNYNPNRDGRRVEYWRYVGTK